MQKKQISLSSIDFFLIYLQQLSIEDLPKLGTLALLDRKCFDYFPLFVKNIRIFTVTFFCLERMQNGLHLMIILA